MSAARLANSPRSPSVAPDTPVGLVVFRLDRDRYALPLQAVDRIVRAVAVTPLPKAPPIVSGVIDVASQVIPVLNVRRRFGLPERALHPDDHFVIARTGHRTVALAIDDAQDVLERRHADVIQAGDIAPHLGHLHGVLQLPDGIVLIQDLEQFLSLDEARALDEAINDSTPQAEKPRAG